MDPLDPLSFHLEPRAQSAISVAGAKVSAAVSPRDKMAMDEGIGCCGINILYIYILHLEGGELCYVDFPTYPLC